VFAMRFDIEISDLVWDLERLRNGANVHRVNNILHQLKLIHLLDRLEQKRLIRQAKLLAIKIRGSR